MFASFEKYIASQQNKLWFLYGKKALMNVSPQTVLHECFNYVKNIVN